MRKIIKCVVVFAIIFCSFISCGGSGGSSTAPTTPTVAAVTKSSGMFGGLMVSDQGETFMPMVSRDSSGNATGITGAVW